MNKPTNPQYKAYPQNLLDALVTDEWNDPLPPDINETLAHVLYTMSNNEQKVIELYYKYKLTFTEISHILNMTRDNVCRIEKHAIRKLRYPTRTELLKTGIRKHVDEKIENARRAGYKDAMDNELRKALGCIVDLVHTMKQDPKTTAKIDVSEYEKLSQEPIDLDELEFSVRTYNCLRRAGYRTLQEVSTLTYEDLKKVRNMSSRSASEIMQKLNEHGLKLAESVDDAENIENENNE